MNLCHLNKETGASYPEMDKLIALCQLFHCDLDVLVNGDVTHQKEKEVKEVTGKELFKKIDNFMKKIVFFFESMTLKDGCKFVFEIMVLLFLLFLFKIPFQILEEVVVHFLQQYTGLHFIMEGFCFLLDFVYVLLSILLFIYVLKIKYLDKVENEQIKASITEGKKQDSNAPVSKKTPIEDKVNVEKIYIQKTGKSVSDVLATLLLWFGKFWVLLFLMSFLACLLTLIVLFGISLSFTIQGLPLLGIVLGLFGGILFLLCLIEPCVNFLFNQKNNGKRIALSALISIVFFALGTTIFAFDVMRLTYHNEISPHLSKKEKTQEFPMQEILNTCYLPQQHVSYVENENLQDQVKVTVRTIIRNVNIDIQETGSFYVEYFEDDAWNFKQILTTIRKDIQQGNFYRYDLDGYLEITVESSHKNILSIQTNSRQCS